MSNRRDRERRQSAARNRAERRTSGFEGTYLRIPSEIDGFFEMKKGTKTIDIIPYIAGKGNPYSEEGMLYFERTFYIYRRVGPDGKSYICPSKTYNERDFIQEWRQKRSAEPDMSDADIKALKALNPKERQIFLVRDHDEPDKLKLWECSYKLFGELLDARIKNASERSGWDYFYEPDETGFSLRLTIVDSDAGDFSFSEVKAIDFEARDEPLPAKFQDHGVCLDDLLVRKTYEELKGLFLGDPPESSEAPEEDDSDQRRQKPKTEEIKKERERPQEKDEPAKSEKKSPPTADEFGIKAQDTVKYDGAIYTVMRVSGDGTSLTLLDDEDNIVKAISPADVKVVKEKKKEEKVVEDDDDIPFDDPPKKEKVEEDSSSVDFDDEDWDKDFD